MKVELSIYSCKVTREPGDPRFRNSGWTFAESIFLHHVKRELQKQGYDVIKKHMWRDGHMMDDTQQYIRTRHYMTTPDNTPNEFAIYNGSYAIYDAGEEFNKRGEIVLLVDRGHSY